MSARRPRRRPGWTWRRPVAISSEASHAPTRGPGATLSEACLLGWRSRPHGASPDGPHHASSRRDAARVSCGPPSAQLCAGHRRNLSQRLKRKPFRVLETEQDSTTSRAGKTTRASTLRALRPAPAAASPGCSRDQRRASAHLSSRGRRWFSRSSPSPTPPRRGTQPPSRRRGPPRRALKSRRGSAPPLRRLPRRPLARARRTRRPPRTPSASSRAAAPTPSASSCARPFPRATEVRRPRAPSSRFPP